MHYRIAQKEDCRSVYDLICEMENSMLPYDRFAQIFHRQLNSSLYECLVCEENGTVIGMLNLRMEEQLHHAARIAEILEFAVHPRYRSKGIGKEMLSRAFQLAIERGCPQMEVACNQLREDTHRFYLREGMQNYHFRFSKNLFEDTPSENALGR